MWPDSETFMDNGKVFDVDLLPAVERDDCTESEDIV